MKWVRVVLALLAVPNIVTGLWAIFSPSSFFENFPGWSPRLVSAHPPYNEHLMTDAGAGLLATGVAALAALIWFRRDIVIVAMATYFAFAAPHALFHLTTPSDLLTGTERATAELPSLILAMLASAAILLWAVARWPNQTGRDREVRAG